MTPREEFQCEYGSTGNVRFVTKDNEKQNINYTYQVIVATPHPNKSTICNITGCRNLKTICQDCGRCVCEIKKDA